MDRPVSNPGHVRNHRNRHSTGIYPGGDFLMKAGLFIAAALLFSYLWAAVIIAYLVATH